MAKTPPAPSSGRLATYRPVLDRLVFGLALLGVLVVVHLWIQTGRGFDRGCLGFSAATAVPAGDCEVVTTGVGSTLFGVSNIIWGLGFYLVLVGLSFVVLFAQGARLQRIKQLRAALIGGGALYSAYLVSLQVTTIGEYCVLCLISASIVGLLLVTQLLDLLNTPDRRALPATAEPRRREAAAFAALTAVTVLVAVVDVVYFRSVPPAAASEIAQPVSDAGSLACRYDPEKPFVEDYQSLVTSNDPQFGNAESGVTVIEIFDPNCPHCMSLYPVMEEVIAERGDVANFYIKPHALWPYSVPQIEALLVAEQQGRFKPMLESMFAVQQASRGRGLSLPELTELARRSGMDAQLLQTRLQSGLYRSIVVRQRQEVTEAGVRSVPAVLINGRFVETRSKECLLELIDAAAQES